jgi:hypothetical protein
LLIGAVPAQQVTSFPQFALEEPRDTSSAHIVNSNLCPHQAASHVETLNLRLAFSPSSKTDKNPVAGGSEINTKCRINPCVSGTGRTVAMSNAWIVSLPIEFCVSVETT